MNPFARGRQITRLEGFSDAVFGFALTLLVVSLEVPQSYDQLVETMRGFAGFACCFAIVAWIWYEHNLFFRRYGLQDGVTVSLNLILLFVVLFYVYPLKFIFTDLVGGLVGGGNATGVRGGATLMVIYSAALVVLFLVFAALYWYALNRRRILKLDTLEVYDARTGMLRHLLTVGMGVASILIAVVVPHRSEWAGLIYFLLGPAHAALGFFRGSRRERLASPAVG